jgi:uncharacterized protein YbjT (DUF2867 family)
VTIAVTTPTGNVGSHVVRMLYQAGMRPRLLLRNPDRLDADVRDQVELAVGDQRDADYVAESTRGVDAVFWVHPDDWSLPDPDADAERTGEGQAAAMRQNRIAAWSSRAASAPRCATARASSTAWPASSRVSTPRETKPAPRCCICAAATS